nr:ABC transporter ATP-binding protein [Streptomyces sp. DSM 41633]
LAAAANTRVATYSTGMQMRLTFARSRINHPELLVLDEPTSGLDPVTARKVKDIILDLKARGRTIFLTTHDMTTADELCDRVAFVVDGTIAALDTPAELKIARSQRRVRVQYRTPGGLATAEYGMDGLAEDTEFQAVLRKHHIETIHSREASLDDVFVEVTGRRLS